MTREMFSAKFRVLSFLGLAVLASSAACSKASPPAPAAAQTAEPTEPTEPTNVGSLPGNRNLVQALRKKQLAELKPPPLTPPADTTTGPLGIKWRTVLPGTGRSPKPTDHVQEEVSIWKGDGTLVYSTLQTDGAFSFPASGLASPILAELQKLKAGARAQFWIPKAAVTAARAQGAMAVPLPEDDLIMEGEILSLDEGPPEKVVDVSGAIGPATAGSAASIPDSAGPPKDASVVAGLKYVGLVAGTGSSKPSKDSRVHLLLTAWPITGLVVRSPVLRDYASVTTPARAPKGISEMVSSMTEGEKRRIWLTPRLGKEIASTDGTSDVVLDITLQTIE